MMATAAMAMFLAVPSYAQESAALESIHAVAAKAETAGQHATVAREYRLQSEAFAAKAAAHEKEAAQLTRGAGAMAYKWPGLASKQLQREKANAVEARRAEREARQLADHHIRRAVEAQAESGVASGN